MGQLLVVHAGAAASAAAADETFARALRLYAALHGVRPLDAWSAGPTRIAKFARRHGSTAMIARSPEAGFAASAGLWWWAGVHGRKRIGEAAARLLAGGDLAPLDGMFALVAGGPDGQDLAIATDRLGTLHLYAAEVGGVRVFATSALVLSALTGASLDDASAAELLGAGSVFEDRSLFRGVRKIPGGTRLRLRGRVLSEDAWFQLGDLFYDRARGTGGVERLADALVAAVRTVLENDAASVLDLTGGYDSRAVLAAALRAGRPFTTVVNGPDDDPDAIAANRIAREFSLRHVHQRPGVELPPRSFASVHDALGLTDGEFDALEYATVAAIHARTSEGGEISVNGSSGETCRGYWWSDLPSPTSVGGFDARRVAARRFAYDGTVDRLLASELRGGRSFAERFAGVVGRSVADLAGRPDAVLSDAVYLRLRMHRWGGRLASATTRLRPCAAPFQFAGTLAAALGSSVAERRGGRMAPRLIARLDPRLAALPLANGVPAEPLRVGNAHKFAPLLGDVARRAKAKLFGGGRAVATESPVADVWRWEEAADLLAPDAMRTASLYERPALEAFLAASRRPDFRDVRPFGRVLTLELVARALEAARGA